MSLSKKEFEQLCELLYKRVGVRIVAESARNAKKVNEDLLQGLEAWEFKIRGFVREVIKEEFKK